jgi:hypothetical protein
MPGRRLPAIVVGTDNDSLFNRNPGWRTSSSVRGSRQAPWRRKRVVAFLAAPTLTQTSERRAA